MDFHKHASLWTLLKKLNWRTAFDSKEQFFSHYLETSESRGDAFSYRRAVLEMLWEKLDRPYYNVYPAIIPMLLKLKLDIPCQVLRDISIQPIEVRLPVDLNVPGLCWAEGRVRSMIIGLQPVPVDEDAEELMTGLCIAFDIGELDDVGHPIMAFKFFPLREDMTIEEAATFLPPHESLKIGVQIPHETFIAIVRLCACIALIDSDSDIIAPDIIVEDRAKWDKASEAERLRLVEKAKKRGKHGWNIGASIEYAPHYRRPHPALVRVGKGRTLTRIVMRKGSVVHRGKLTEIPSGFGIEEI